MTEPFVRPYDPDRDFDNGLNVFYGTIDSGIDWEPARTIGSHLWYKPYVMLSPATCFVLDDGSGRAVGYCIGVADTTSFSQRWRDEFALSVDETVVPKPNAMTGEPQMDRQDVRGFRASVYNGECSMLLAWPQTLEKYPAHMHIDILPEFQRQGHGRKLIYALFDAVKKEGAQGLHLDMLRSNKDGEAFYKKIGFEMCPQVLDGGESKLTGVNGVVMTLVKEL